MSGLLECVPRLAQIFDENLRTESSSGVEGWGQFVNAERQSQQIGLYGCCSGVLVKSIAEKDVVLSQGIVNFFEREWTSRNGATSNKRLVQTTRLAFLVLSISSIPQLYEIKRDVVSSLLRRQLQSGEWADWAIADVRMSNAGRHEATALAVLALCRVATEESRSSAARGAKALQRFALSHENIASGVDPLVLAAIVTGVEADDLDPRVIRGVIEFISTQVPTTDLGIYFFDYPIPCSEGVEETRRDFLCLPKFLSYSAMVSPKSLLERAGPIEKLKIRFAADRATKYLLNALRSPPIIAGSARLPSTVDQASAALAVEFLSSANFSLNKFLSAVQAIGNWSARSWITQFAFPIVLVASLGLTAKDPRHFAELITGMSSSLGAPAMRLATAYESAIQWASFAITVLVGAPLTSKPFNYVRKKWFS